jgi:pyruvate,water dikinase
LEARELVVARLRGVPWVRPLFLRTLDAQRALTRFREQSHFDLTRPLGALQEIAGEWGIRLAAQGALAWPEEVFFLTHPEVRDGLLGTGPGMEEVRRIVATRKATYQIVNTRWQEERCPRTVGGSRLEGLATSPGMATGPVRIIRGEHQFDRLKPGEVLVSSYTNPSWTPLFALASAVVTETGGPASHAAIVAREYGIPCVMAVAGAMQNLRDGEQIQVDGNEGRVHRAPGKWGF